MDEQSLMEFIARMTERGDSAMGEDDYKDFLANYMNAQNQGASEDQIQAMLSAFSPQRQQEMMNYGGGPNFEKDPNISAARSSLNNLLKPR